MRRAADSLVHPPEIFYQPDPKTPGMAVALREGGFPPQVWGPSFWKSMHFTAAAFPLDAHD